MLEVRALHGVTAELFRDEILPGARPVILRGLARDWPAVCAPDSLAYLRAFASPQRCEMLVGDPAIGGRFFYDAAMSGLNFARESTTLPAAIDRVAMLAQERRPPAIAIQSIPIAEAL